MSNASVNLAIVKNAQSVCNDGIQDLNRTASKLQQHYLQAGEQWKDSKYSQLGGIVHECSTAIRNPIQELIDCLDKLKEIEIAVVSVIYEKPVIKKSALLEP